MRDEIARQIIVEIIDLSEQIDESIKQLKPSHIIKMYQEFLSQKQDELGSMSK